MVVGESRLIYSAVVTPVANGQIEIARAVKQNISALRRFGDWEPTRLRSGFYAAVPSHTRQRQEGQIIARLSEPFVQSEVAVLGVGTLAGIGPAERARLQGTVLGCGGGHSSSLVMTAIQ